MLDAKIDPGELDVRIGLLSPTETVNAPGDVEESFTLAKTVSGKVEYPDVGQNEVMMAEKIYAVRTAYVTIRKYSLNERWRLKIDEQEYDILSITKLNRNEFLRIEAERRL